MGIITGIKAISEATTPREDVQYEKARWLRLSPGEQVTLRFINELDADSPHFDPDRGLAILVNEHQPPTPDGYKRHALCTMQDINKCWACEQISSDRKWRSKQKFYVNVMVDDGKESPYAAVWSMGTYRSPNFEAIKEHFLDTNSISNLTWKLKRNGSGTETTYLFMPKTVDTKPFSWPSDVVPYDLTKIIRNVPYEQQAKFYGFEASNVLNANEESDATESVWL